MCPNKEGIWEWFEKDGTKRLVSVFDVNKPIGQPPYFRVYWWGGYYNVSDDPTEDGPFGRIEWEDRWGNFVAELGTLSQEELYLMPTPEQLTEILKRYEKV